MYLLPLIFISLFWIDLELGVEEDKNPPATLMKLEQLPLVPLLLTFPLLRKEYLPETSDSP